MIIYKKLFNNDEFNNLIISIRLPQVYLSNTDGIDDRSEEHTSELQSH